MSYRYPLQRVGKSDQTFRAARKKLMVVCILSALVNRNPTPENSYVSALLKKRYIFKEVVFSRKIFHKTVCLTGKKKQLSHEWGQSES